jgi:HK97 family phage prohead protease
MEFGSIGVSWEVKFTDPTTAPGTFEGYGAVFGNIDTHGDVIEPGTFAKSLLERQREGRALPPMYKMHGAATGNAHEPIGIWDAMSEDSTGLHVKGHLIGLDTEQGKWTLAQLREGALPGLSIGYRVSPNGAKSGGGRAGEPKRFIKMAMLREVSLVDDPSNHRALVYAMKAAARFDMATLLDPRALEAELRRELKISGADAVRAVGILKKHLRDAGDDEPATDLRDEGAAADMVGALQRLTATLSNAKRI